MVTQNVDIKMLEFSCDKCSYNTGKKSSYEKHLLTAKHNLVTFGDDNVAKKCEYICGVCSKKYISRNGLWCHKKTCINKNIEQQNEKKEEYNNTEMLNNNVILEILKQHQTILEKNSSDSKDSLIMELVKQNQEFKELMLEQNKHMLELAKNAGNNNNNTTNNTKFNLQFFLNETCKDAMNITDFVNSLVLDFEDLENMGHLGYVEGISRIFMRGIRGMDVTKRPFHCSDIKRETMFVKELEGWEKENSDNEKMTMTIKRIACKNLRQATAWMAAHQKAIADTDSKPHSQYMKMMSQCLGGATAAEDKSNYNKIIRRVAQEVFIDKK